MTTAQQPPHRPAGPSATQAAAGVDAVASPVSGGSPEANHGAPVDALVGTHGPTDAWHPLSAIQRSLWFQYQLYPELQGCYNIAFVARIRPMIALPRLQAALDQVAARHAMLRTRFALVDGQPRQQAVPAVVIPVALHPVASLDDAALDPTVQLDRARPFDLSQAPCVRASLYVQADRPDEEGVMLLALDHLVCDAWSLWQLLDELAALLQADGQDAAELPPVGPSFFSHVQQQHAWLDSPQGQRQLAHWRSELAAPPPTLALPIDALPAGPATQALRRTWALDLPDPLTARLRDLAARQGCSMFTVLLAGFFVLLNRLTGQRQLAVGSPMPARGAEWARTVGSFTNPVVLRADLDQPLNVAQLLQQLQSRSWRALKNQHYPLAELVERLRPERAESGQPYYRALFVAQKARAAERTLGLLAHAKSIGQVPWAGFQLSAFGRPQNNGGSGMDLLMEVAEIGDSLMTGLDYDTTRFSADTIRRWMACWQTLLQAMTEGDDQPLQALTLLPAAERHLVLHGWNQTSQDLPLHRCVHELFEAQVQRTPSALAVLDDAHQLSYAQLNTQANQLAHYLHDLGVRPDDRVALCCPRGAPMLVALLAIWKAGGAYVPLDPAYPADRLAHMLADSHCPVVLCLGTQDRLAPHLPPGALLVDLAAQAGHWLLRDGSDLPVSSLGLNARHLAYVIYTSGSTGLPKGVMVEHRSLVNYALDARGWFGLGPTDRVLQQNALNFDLSIEEIVPALLAGAALLPCSEIFGLQADSLRPSVVHLTAAHWHTLVGEWVQAGSPDQPPALLDGVRLVNVTGDALSPHKLQQWDRLRPPGTVLINTYGPTEITVSCSAAYVRHDPAARRVSIGKPFANTRLYLLDGQGQPVPIGVEGELYIGGVGVARGYLNRPELTAQRFLADPFCPSAGGPEARDARMYRTGDLARWLPDGQVEFIGRNDFQVKVRGFRIELGEVETALSRCIGVAEVVVLARGEQAHDKRLVAYVTGEVDEARLRAHAAQALPQHMWPQAYVHLAQMPKTPGGKLDRGALPAPQRVGLALGLDDGAASGAGNGDGGADGAGTAEAHQEPQGATEQAIARQWAELLGCPAVGRHDNFFALGGHSLLAVQMVERLRRLGLVVPVRALFGTAPTVAGLARLADEARSSALAGSGAADGTDPANTEPVVPPNRIPPDATHITPDMLSLVDLSQDQIDAIVANIPGGAANVQDIYPLTHAQEGILFHHQLQPEHDAYVVSTLLACRQADDLDRFITALQAAVDRHDVLRSGVVWQGLDAPLQVVHRRAALAPQRLRLDPADGDIATQLRALADSPAGRLALGQPPLLRLGITHDPVQQRWLLLLLAHHIMLDNLAQAALLDEVNLGLQGLSHTLAPATPYRHLVARTRWQQRSTASDAFFRRVLADITQPTHPYGLGDGRLASQPPVQTRQTLPAPLSQRLRAVARRHQVSLASLMHLAWALVLGQASGQRSVVFGTVLLGRSSGLSQSLADGAQPIGLYINTLPLRLDIDTRPLADSLRHTHALLAELLQHEQASLASACRCSAVPGDQALFGALFNFRHVVPAAPGPKHGRGLDNPFERLHDQEQSNYPLSLDVDDLGQDLALLVQTQPAVSPQRVCDHLHTTLAALADALQSTPNMPLHLLQVLPAAECQPVLPAQHQPARHTATEGAPDQADPTPQGPTEQAMARVWAELMGRPQVSRHDNFFALGGHSLLAVQLVERLRRLGLAVPVRALFGSNPTVAELARLADEANAAALASNLAGAAGAAAANGTTADGISQANAEHEVPPNRIPETAQQITPDMLTLVDLSQDQIDHIVAQVPGGAANLQDIYPLTHAQEGILFHHQLQPEHDAYVETTLLACPDEQDVLALADALQVVVDRHDILRSQVLWAGLEQPLQVVHRQARLAHERLDLRAVPGDGADIDIATQLRQLADSGALTLDLSRPPLLRLCSAPDPANRRWLVLLAVHHIIVDNVAQAVLLQELQQIIQARAEGRLPQLPPPVPYRAFVFHARLRQDGAAAEAFFRRLLGDIDTPTSAYGLAESHVDGRDDGQGQAEARHDLPRALSQRLRGAARQHRVSLASLMHLAWALVLGQASGQPRVVFGTVLLGRSHGRADADRQIGMFINTLPVRVDLADRPAAAALQQLHALLAEMMRHEHASLGQASRCSAVPGDRPLFNMLFNYRHGDIRQDVGQDSSQPDSGLRLQVLHDQERSNYPLSLDVDDLGEDLALLVQADPSVSPQRVCDHLQATLAALADALQSAPDTPLHRLQTLPTAERHQVLHGWNQTSQDMPLNRCVHELFEAQVQRTPSALAVLDDAHQLSYAQLNTQANQLAHYLHDLGVRPDDRVALCCPRGAPMLVALLAIWKAGGAYVPLDPAYPADRLAHMLADSHCPVVLCLGTQDRLAPHLPPGALLVDLAAQAGHWLLRDGSDLPVSSLGLNARHLAYVIYTSGSTGLPKGVMVEHRSLVNYALDARGWFGLGPTDRVLQQNALNFDLSIEEIVPALLAGAALLPCSEIFGLQADSLRPSVVHLTAAHWHTLVGEWVQAGSPDQPPALLDGVRLVNVTGDALSPHKLQQWDRLRPPGTVLINTYGPTEITVSCSAAYVRHDPAARRVSIGKPFANTRLYLLDGQGQPVPIGVEGELYIGGVGVARGYLNRPELTAQRFLADPFCPSAGGPEARDARMYRTGDLARWLPDGQVEFIGRNDFQVKVRGFRIELGEVETALSRCIGVAEVVVLARGEQAHDKRLVAYVTGEVDEARLRAHAAQALPQHMWPQAYVHLAQMPKTPGGKLDRGALPAPQRVGLALGLDDGAASGAGNGDGGADGAGTAEAHQEPQGATEQAIARQWAELLGCPAVGRHDNFFALGGHSLLAVQMVERLRRLGLVVPVRALFGTAPTVAGLARLAGNDAAADGTTANGADPANAEHEVPPNRIPTDATHITPDMLSLVDLSQDQIDAIVAQVPGGAANVQDIYPLTHAQAEILGHHTLHAGFDPWGDTTILACDSAQQRDRVIAALQQVVDRHDILRTRFVWQGLPQPVQVVQRGARLSVQALDLPAMPVGGAADPLQQLKSLAADGVLRVALGQAPVLRLCTAHDPARQRWLLMLLGHHIVLDHEAEGVLLWELNQLLDGQGHTLEPPVPFRGFVARALARAQADSAASLAFFADMLADIDQPTLAHGLADVQGSGQYQREAQVQLPAALSLALRQLARQHRVSVASLMHLTWARVLADTTGLQRVVFGTILFGRGLGGPQADQQVGMFTHTLPIRVDVDLQPLGDVLRQVHARLAGLLRHETTDPGLASACSAVPDGLPLFNTLFNYRYGDTRGSLQRDQAHFELLAAQERSNYPLSLDVDDLGVDLALVVQADPRIDPDGVAAQVLAALHQLAQSLPATPRAADNAAWPAPSPATPRAAAH